MEFKASPVYISSSRTAIANTEIPLREREKKKRGTKWPKKVRGRPVMLTLRL